MEHTDVRSGGRRRAPQPKCPQVRALLMNAVPTAADHPPKKAFSQKAAVAANRRGVNILDGGAAMCIT